MESPTTSTGSTNPVEKVPLEIWRRIMLNCDNRTLLSLEKTAGGFKTMLEDNKFWLERAIHQNKLDSFPPAFYREHKMLPEFSYRPLAMLKRGFKRTPIFEIGKGNCFKRELKTEIRLPDNSKMKAVAVKGFKFFEISIDIELVENLGIDPWVLDVLRPKISVTQVVGFLKEKFGILRFWGTLHDGVTPDDGTTEQVSVCYLEDENSYGVREASLTYENYAPGMRHLTIIIVSRPVFIIGKAEKCTYFGNMYIDVELPNEMNIEEALEDADFDPDDDNHVGELRDFHRPSVEINCANG